MRGAGAEEKVPERDLGRLPSMEIVRAVGFSPSLLMRVSVSRTDHGPACDPDQHAGGTQGGKVLRPKSHMILYQDQV